MEFIFIISLWIGAVAALLIMWARLDRQAPAGLRAVAFLASLCLLIIVAACPAVIYHMLLVARGKSNQISCMTNLSNIGSALALYEADQGALPGESWNDQIAYRTSQEDFRCPELDEDYGYSLNSGALWMKTGSILTPSSFVVLFDGPGGANRVGGADTVQYRHAADTALFLFADGRAASVNRRKADSLTWHENLNLKQDVK
ncbi:MAG: hypothetical protein H0W86_02390 [Armatimonadetes bacterium]|nr:hypothetical protein [Armatimonadota bacterium]